MALSVVGGLVVGKAMPSVAVTWLPGPYLFHRPTNQAVPKSYAPSLHPASPLQAVAFLTPSRNVFARFLPFFLNLRYSAFVFFASQPIALLFNFSTCNFSATSCYQRKINNRIDVNPSIHPPNAVSRPLFRFTLCNSPLRFFPLVCLY